MIIDLTKLNSGLIDEISIDENITFSKEDLKGTDLIDLKDVSIKGYLYKDSLDGYSINANIKGTMVLPCSRTLKPTEYSFDIEMDENIDETKENLKKHQKSIDIFPIIWENILMEIPIKVINPESLDIDIKGDGWELITDSEN